MNRELAGVVASMQELELACDELETREDLLNLDALKELRSKIASFFASPSVPHAKGVLDWIGALHAESNPEKSAGNLLKASVTVDGMSTSLERLAKELEEVLADF